MKYDSISIEEIVREMAESPEPLFQNKLIDRLMIDGTKLPGKIIRFDGCKFINEAAFANFQDGIAFVFQRCTADFLTFTGFRTQTHTPYPANLNFYEVDVNNLRIEDCTLQKGIDILDSWINRFLVKDCNNSKHSDIIIRNDNSEPARAFFINRILINKSSWDSFKLTFHENVGDILSFDSHFKMFHIGSCKLTNLHVEKGNYTNVDLSSTTTTEKTNIIDISCSGELSIRSCIYEKTVFVKLDNEKEDEDRSPFLNRISVNYSKFLDGIYLVGNRRNVPQKLINEVALIFTANSEGTLSLDKLIIGKLFLAGTNRSSDINIDFVQVDELVMSGFTNFSVINISHFYSSTTNSKLHLIHSELGNTKLQKVRFDEFKNCYIYNTDFSNIKAFNVKWFEFSKLEQDLYNNLTSTPRNEINESLRDLARTLKYAMSKQDNIINSLYFRQYEFKYYKLELKGLAQPDKLSSRISLFFGTTNTDGTNTIKPFLLILSSLLIIYPLLILIYYLNLPNPEYGYECYLRNNFAYIPTILNPTADAKKYFGSSFEYTHHPIMIIVEYLSKLWLAFLFVQTITAFRKYFK